MSQATVQSNNTPTSNSSNKLVSVTNGNGSNNGTNGQSNSKCNLIVNYLPQSMKEHDFCQLFSKIGPIKTCKLMYDKQTGYSFGYGFVDYQNVEDANRAIETLNGFQIEHKRLKVAYARPNCEDTKNTNLYLRNLPTTYDENNLTDLFSQYGEVVQVRILRDPVTNFSRRIGFVIMSTKQMALSAIENLDNQIPPNGTEPIHIKYADEEGKKKQVPRNSNSAIHTHHSTNGFQNLGKMKNNRGNGNRYNPMSTNFNYGYSNFAQGGSANFDGLINGYHNGFITQQQQQQQQNGGGHHPHHQNHHNNGHHGGHHNNNNNHHHGHHGHTNRNNHNQHQHQQQQQAATAGITNGLMHVDGQNGQLGEKGGHIIYVYGIGPNAGESDLYTLFQNYGTILRINVIKNQKTGLGKGYGFVVFEHYEEACYAVQQMNGYIYNNRPLQVAFKAFNKNQ